MRDSHGYNYDINPFCFCITCGEELKKRDVIDVLADARICQNGHRSYIPIRMIAAPSDFKGKWKRLEVQNEDDYVIAKTWLNEIGYREHFHEDFAAVLRLQYEILTNTYGENNQSEAGQNPYTHCPICARRLGRANIDMGASWAMPFKCENEHLFFLRSGLSYVDKNKDRITLKAEINPKYLSRWFVDKKNRDRMMEEFVPHQLIPILIRFAEQVEKRKE